MHMQTNLVCLLLLVSPLLMAESQPHGMHHHHHHGKRLDVPTDRAAPSISCKMHPDNHAPGSYNLEIVTENFRFTPEAINQAAQFNSGHGHIYVNSKKMGRVYSNWVYLPTLPAGEVSVRVTLNANTHEDFYVNGQPIECVVKLKHRPYR